VDFDVDVEASVSPRMPTVATVGWDLVHPGATEAFVEFGPDRAHDRRARAEVDDSGRARALLVGMKPEAKIQFRAGEVVSDKNLFSDWRDLETGTLGVPLPELRVDVHDPDRASGGFVVTSVLSQPSAAVIIDVDGDVVWAHQPDLDWEQLMIVRALRSHSGDWIAYHAGIGYGGGGPEPTLESRVVRVGVDGSEQEVLAIPGAHHDLFEHADGSYAILTHDWRTVDGESIQGDRLAEVAADGSERTVWSVWDHFEFNPDLGYAPDLGWSHANAVNYDKAEDAYYVSLHNLDCIVKIDRRNGEQLWVLGGRESDFALPDDDKTLFQRQHQFELLDGGILVFDNGLSENQDSRAVEYALDEGSGRAELRWEYHLDPPRYNVALGDVRRLPNGNTLVTWCALGQIDEVTPDGDVVWRLRSAVGSGFGYSMWRGSLSRPQGLGGD